MSLSCLGHFFSHASFLFTSRPTTCLLIGSLIAFIATQRSSSSTSQDVKKRKGDDSSCFKEEEKEEDEEEENVITSSLSSSSTSRRKYDVFLSFYGKDTRTSFTSHLYDDLNRRGINVYRDDEKVEKGKYIRQELLQAIQESQCAIIILSANYAFSKWCLMELAEIVEWKEKKELTIIPIFYHVDPSHVRNQIGPFAAAFVAHERDLNDDTATKIDIWKNAFRKVGNIAGEHIHPDHGYESEIIQRISEKIFYNYTMPNILFYHNTKLVAINSPVEQMMKLLDMESKDVRFLGIHGMGGVGKTTLARVIYDRVFFKFDGGGFISCIRQNSTTTLDLASLQEKLLSMIMTPEKRPVYDHYLGIKMIGSRLRGKRVLIVLDDVDSEEQLMALAGSRDWFGTGSRVIITCRDRHLLITHKVNAIYEVEQLQTADALQLFSLSAFDKTRPPENYIDLCMYFLRYAQGLPLALKVLGSSLFERTIDTWKSVRDTLEANPDQEIMKVLQISLEGLKDSQKNLFFDLACCFERQLVHYIKKIYSDFDIEVLVDKSLITKDMGMLLMHDLLRKMGQDIVCRECPKEPGRRTRIFGKEDVYHVLENDTGTDVIECLVLTYTPAQMKKINTIALSKMKNLRCLMFDQYTNIEWRGNPLTSQYTNIECRGDPLKYMPTSQLQILHWHGYHLKSWPSCFHPNNLIVLSMRHSHFEQLWKGSMDLCKLKEIDLCASSYLIEIPDLTGAPNLEEIDLTDCKSLCEVHPSVGALKKLKVLKITRSRIKQVWKGLVDLCNLKKIDLSTSRDLIELPDLTGAPNLEEINLSCCQSLCEVHPSIGALKKLRVLKITSSGIKQVWMGMVDLCNLKRIDLSSSKYLIEIPDLTGAPNLEEIYLKSCESLCEVHPSVGALKKLKVLEVTNSRIKQVWKGLVDLCNLRRIDLSFSKYLIEIPDLTGAPNLEEIYLISCKSLCEVHPSVGALKKLQVLKITNSRIKQVWKGLVDLCNLKKIDLSTSRYLIEIPDLTGAPNLEEIYVTYCSSLCEVHPSVGALKKLQVLKITHSHIKQVWKGLVDLCNLKKIDLSASRYLIEIPDLTGAPNLEEIYFTDCNSLCEVHPSVGALKKLQVLKITHSHIKQVWKGLVDLCNLKKIDLSYSRDLIEIPDLTGAPNLEEINFSCCQSLCEVHPSVRVLKPRHVFGISSRNILVGSFFPHITMYSP